MKERKVTSPQELIGQVAAFDQHCIDRVDAQPVYSGRDRVATSFIPPSRGAEAIAGLAQTFGCAIRAFEHFDVGHRKSKRVRRAAVKADITLPDGVEFYFSGPVSALGELLRSGNINNSKSCFLNHQDEGCVLRAQANAQLMAERIDSVLDSESAALEATTECAPPRRRRMGV